MKRKVLLILLLLNIISAHAFAQNLDAQESYRLEILEEEHIEYVHKMLIYGDKLIVAGTFTNLPGLAAGSEITPTFAILAFDLETKTFEKICEESLVLDISSMEIVSRGSEDFLVVAGKNITTVSSSNFTRRYGLVYTKISSFSTSWREIKQDGIILREIGIVPKNEETVDSTSINAAGYFRYQTGSNVAMLSVFGNELGLFVVRMNAVEGTENLFLPESKKISETKDANFIKSVGSVGGNVSNGFIYRFIVSESSLTRGTSVNVTAMDINMNTLKLIETYPTNKTLSNEIDLSSVSEIKTELGTYASLRVNEIVPISSTKVLVFVSGNGLYLTSQQKNNQRTGVAMVEISESQNACIWRDPDLPLTNHDYISLVFPISENSNIDYLSFGVLGNLRNSESLEENIFSGMIMHTLGMGSGNVSNKLEPISIPNTENTYYRVAVADKRNIYLVKDFENTASGFTRTKLFRYEMFPRSISDGNWSDPNTWSTTSIPSSTDNVNIASNVILDQDITINSIYFQTVDNYLDISARTMTVKESIKATVDRAYDEMPLASIISDRSSMIILDGEADSHLQFDNPNNAQGALQLRNLLINKQDSKATVKLDFPKLQTDSLIVLSGKLNIENVFLTASGIRVENQASVAANENTVLKYHGTGALPSKLTQIGTFLISQNIHLEGDLSVKSSLYLMSGASLDIRSHKLSLSGLIYASQGASLNLEQGHLEILDNKNKDAPQFPIANSFPIQRINRLTLDRESGIQLYSNLTINEALYLKKGTLQRKHPSLDQVYALSYKGLNVDYGSVDPHFNEFVSRVSGEWTNPSVWNLQGAQENTNSLVPSGTDKVTIQHEITINGSASVGMMIIENGGYLLGGRLSSGSNNVTINNTLEINDGGDFDEDNLQLNIGGSGDEFLLTDKIKTLRSLSVSRKAGMRLQGNLEILDMLRMKEGILNRANFLLRVQGEYIRNENSYVDPSISVIRSKQNGNWYDSNTWEKGTVPLWFDDVEIRHNVVINENVNIKSLNLKSGQLSLSEDKSISVTNLAQEEGSLDMGKNTNANILIIQGTGNMVFPKNMTDFTNLWLKKDGIITLSNHLRVKKTLTLESTILNRGFYDIDAAEITYSGGGITPALTNGKANSFRGSWVKSINNAFINGRTVSFYKDTNRLYLVGEFLSPKFRTKVARYQMSENIADPITISDLDMNEKNLSKLNIKALVQHRNYFYVIEGDTGSLWRRDTLENSAWEKLGDLSGDLRAMAVVGDDIWIGGSFTRTLVGGVNIRNLIKWEIEGKKFSPISDKILQGGAVNAILENDGNVYIGGAFTTIGDVEANGIAFWESLTNSWQPLTENEGVVGEVKTLAIHEDFLYIGGNFYSVDQVPARSIAKYNMTVSTWSSLGQGIVGEVLSIAVPHKDYVYAGGKFFIAGGKSVSNVSRWSDVLFEWEQPQISFDSDATIRAITYQGSTIFFGGDFSFAQDEPVFALAGWVDSVLVELYSPTNSNGSNPNQIFDAKNLHSNIPDNLEVNQNFPNPFSNQTTIEFALPKAAHATIYVYNILGQLVAKLVDSYLQSGYYSTQLDARSLSSGTYYYYLLTSYGERSPTKKVFVLK